MSLTVKVMGTPKVMPTDYEQIINYAMLYDSGDECTDVTGGLTTSGYSTKVGSYTITAATKNANNIYTAATSSTRNMLGTANAIDMTPFTTLYAIATPASSSNGGDLMLLPSKDLSATHLAHTGVIASGKSMFTLDVTDINQEGYVTVYSQGSTARTCTWHNVFLIKPDDINTLCDKAGVTPTDLATLLADTTRLTKIFNNEDAVKYMVAQCTGDFMVGVLNSADAVALLKTSPYLNTVVGNPHWAKFVMMIPTAKELLNVTMLYDAGDECTDVTGGWGATAYSTNLVAVAPTITKNAGNINIVSVGADRGGACSTTNKIDLTDYKTILVRYSGTVSNRYANSFLIIDTVNTGKSKDSIASKQALVHHDGSTAPTTVTNGIKELDISSYSGEQYVMISMLSPQSGTATNVTLFDLVMVKADNWITWATIVGVSATDLDTLLADSAKMATLMSNEDACKYLMGCTGDLMVSICNSEVAMNALVSNIAYDYAFNHPVWYKFMTMIPTSLEAMDSVAVTVPTMTSATTPSGVVSASSEFSSTYAAYKAFDNSQGTYWAGAQAETAIGSWVAYEWAEKMIPYKIRIKPAVIGTKYRGDGVAPTFTIQGLSDSDEWVDIESFTANTTAEVSSNYTEDYIISNPDKPYRALRYIMVTNPTGGTKGSNIILGEINFYGKAVD